MHLKISSAKWLQFCPGGDELINSVLCVLMAVPPHGLCGLPEQLVAGSGASVNLLGHCLDPRSLLGSQLPDAAGTAWQGRGDVLVTGRPIQGLAWLSGHKQCIPLHASDTHPGTSFLPKKMHHESWYRFRNPHAACIWIQQENDRFFQAKLSTHIGPGYCPHMLKSWCQCRSL